MFGSRSLRGLPPTIDGGRPPASCSLPGLPLTIDGGRPPTSSVRRILARCREASSHTLSEPHLALFPCGCDAAHHVAHPLRKPWPLGAHASRGLGSALTSDQTPPTSQSQQVLGGLGASGRRLPKLLHLHCGLAQSGDANPLAC